VVDVAFEFLVFIAVETFQRHEDVTAFLVPMEVVEIWIKGMVCGELGRVEVVRFFGDA